MNTDILTTGTHVTEGDAQTLRAGPLQVKFAQGGLRWLCWNGVEVLRAVQFLVRTPGWGTPAPMISDLDISTDDGGFSVAYTAHYGDAGAGVVAQIGFVGSAHGTLTATATIQAEVPFETNRTGFVILHPLDGFAGTEVLVDHASEPPRRQMIPAQISPGQPVFDMRAITHTPVPGLTVETRFDGDIFEMEDHRNWSDASFKTYSRPIGLPYPYQLLPGTAVTQAVTVTITDKGAQGSAASAVAVPNIGGQIMPEYALPLGQLADAATALEWAGALGAIAPAWILLHLDGPQATSETAPLAQLLQQTGARLEVQLILHAQDDAGAEAEIAALAAHLAGARIAVGRISAFSKVDEASFQPGQARPPHPSEPAIAASLARHFGGADRLGGTPAFFTEFNRKRPDPALWQGLRFATTPVVHAADDASVMETLESLPHILGSAQALADGLALSIGPVGIGARVNPYGPGPTVNAPDARDGMAARDPRQRGLFAAAWTVGYLARIAPFAPRQFSFGAPTGPFGLISTPQEYTRALWDDLPKGALYPLYHVAAWIAGAGGAELVVADTKAGVARLVWRKNGLRHALVANLTASAQPMPDLGMAARAMVLDAGSVTQFATGKPEDQPPPHTLSGYAVAFLTEEGPRP